MVPFTDLIVSTIAADVVFVGKDHNTLWPGIASDGVIVPKLEVNVKVFGYL